MEALDLEAGRGGLKAGALRFCAGFKESGMIKSARKQTAWYNSQV